MISLPWLLTSAWLALMCQVSARGNIKLHLMRYVNRDGRDNEGDLCDTLARIKTSDCDPYFKLCVGTAGTSDCSIAVLQSDVYRDSNSVSFGSTFGSRSNPIDISFSTWPQAGVRIKIQVFDDDNRSDDDLIDSLETTVVDTPSPSVNHALTREVLIRGRTQLFGSITVYCDQSWYGTYCQRYCSPQDDDSRGHYTCSESGEQLCLPGWQGDDCKEDVDECLSNPCQNGGLCVNGKNSFTCQCEEGFTDTLCQTDIDECLSDPCLNGGTCHDVINGFRCSCLPQYSGLTCEADVCHDVICLNGGSCEVVSGTVSCLCLPGYHGTWCEDDIDECQSDPCQGAGSTCTDLINGFRCTCADGRTGATCSDLLYPPTTSFPVEISTSLADPCSGDPCVMGTCQPTGSSSYACRCSPGYAGHDCSVDLCSGSVCGENGTCVRAESGYVCHCADGTSGPNCNTSAGGCDDVTCLNGGKCLPTDDSFICQCESGFKGDRCQLVVRPCQSSPCLHGATCTDLDEGYRCICPDSYAGERCEKQIRTDDPDSREVLLFVGDLDSIDLSRLEQSILQRLESNADDYTLSSRHRLIYDTHTCQGQDGISVTVFTFQVVDGAGDVISGNRLRELIGQLTATGRDVILPRPLYNGTDCTVATSVGRSTDRLVRPLWPLVVGVTGAALVIGIIASLIVAYNRRKTRTGRFDVITNPLYDSGERRGTTDTVLNTESEEQPKSELDRLPSYFRSHSQEYRHNACAVDD